MNSEFIVAIRKASDHLDSVSEWDISQIQKHRQKLIKEIKQTISKHPEIGKRQLVANFNEIHKEYEYVKTKVKHRLNELREAGQDEHNTNFSKSCEDALFSLLELLQDYFPETARKNHHFYKEITTPTLANNKKL